MRAGSSHHFCLSDLQNEFDDINRAKPVAQFLKWQTLNIRTYSSLHYYIRILTLFLERKLNKQITIITAIVLIVSDLAAQSIERQVFSSAGFHSDQIEFNIGEVMTSTFQSDEQLLTQGFEQGELIDIAVNEIPSMSSLLIYPNPTRFNFAVATPGQSSSLHIMILDMTGKLVEEIAIYQETQNVDVTNLAAGTYMLHINSTDQKINERHLLIKL